MAFETWESAVAELERTAGPATPVQEDLAARLETDLDPGLPARVAAEVLRERLREPLLLLPPTAPSDGQLHFLFELAREVGASRPGRTESKALVGAWIDVMLARRAITALTTLELRRGDIVELSNQGSGDFEEVASISATGRVNFVGGRGRGNWPHRLLVVARQGDVSEAAVRIQVQAANQRALRQEVAVTPSRERLTALRPYRVDQLPDAADLAILEASIDNAADETPIHSAL